MAASDSTPAAPSTAQKIGTTIAADATTAENFIVKYFNIVMGYLPKTWQRIVAGAVAIWLLWQLFGGLLTGVASFAWGYVPERATVVRALPASQDAVGQVADTASKRADQLTSQVKSLKGSVENLSQALASVVEENSGIEKRLEAIESAAAEKPAGFKRRTKLPAE